MIESERVIIRKGAPEIVDTPGKASSAARRCSR
jgi:hypothetical protein